MSEPKKLEDIELFAWMGEDELGSGEIGIKQGLCAAGYIPLVAVDREKMERPIFKVAMGVQAKTYGKRIKLVRFKMVDVLYETEDGQ